MTGLKSELFCDFYGLTMAQQAIQCGMGGQRGWFELFFRRIPDQGGFVIAAGLEPVLQELEEFSFSEDAIGFLRKRGDFSPEFLAYLKQIRFTGDVYAVPEGTPVFPGEPLFSFQAPLFQGYLLETRLLQKIGYASLIATKANRIIRSAQGLPVWEFGARRAHGMDAAVEGARAAYLGGCAGSSCTAAQAVYGVPITGTMSHAWVQQFPTEYEAFCTWCSASSQGVVLLVDTYDTLTSGVPNAIRAFQEVLLPRGITSFGVRLDSGDLAGLSRQVRRMLDDAGLFSCRILVSNALDEYRVEKLLSQGAAIDAFGVGERLITAKSDPVLGCVLKLTALEQPDGTLLPKYKWSETPGKSTLPYPKQIFRMWDTVTGTAKGDWICRQEETPEQAVSEIPQGVQVKSLLQPVMRRGVRLQFPMTLAEQQAYTLEQVDTLPEEVRRMKHPLPYPLHLSAELAAVRRELRQMQESQKSGM